MQNRRAFLFLALAVIFGLGAAFLAQRWLEDQRQQPVFARSTTPVAVVRADLAAGSVVASRDLISVDWPLGFVPEGAFASPEQVEGRVLRRALAGGEPVLRSALLPEGSPGGLISMIDPTMRAMSVKVDPVIGVAGFVVPGSHVDVIVTIRRIDLASAMPYSKVILQNVKVLAIDQKLEGSTNRSPELVQVVTLEVAPDQAQKLAYAVNEGKLQLALRHPSDREIVATRSISVGEVLEVPRIVVAAPVVRPPRVTVHRDHVEVIKGAELSVEQF